MAVVVVSVWGGAGALCSGGCGVAGGLRGRLLGWPLEVRIRMGLGRNGKAVEDHGRKLT